MSTKKLNDIKSLTYDQLVEWLDREGIKSYRAGQILRWVYQRRVDSFDAMTDLGKALRMRLADQFRISRLSLLKTEVSQDGSRKYLFQLMDGNLIETVLIPEKNHYTLCISSQVGCAQGCRFCMTAQGGFIRNLGRDEILAQVLDVQRELEDPTALTNIVLMGMGEPLANYANVVSAMNTFVGNQSGFGLASRRITLSTAGLVPRIETLGHDTPVNIAVSLNATENDTRTRLMPINRKYPIEQLIDVCSRYPLRSGRRITFEYILIRDVNDSLADARRLARLLTPVRCKINLIPFNSHEGSEYQPPSARALEAFQEILLQKHFTTMVRYSKGSDISAACGQLRAKALEAVSAT
jgi:23S rRNA (adenine2503-C2)-methyltransferase